MAHSHRSPCQRYCDCPLLRRARPDQSHAYRTFAIRALLLPHEAATALTTDLLRLQFGDIPEAWSLTIKDKGASMKQLEIHDSISGLCK